MSQLFNYTFTCRFTTTYTARSYEEALERLNEDEEYDDIEDCTCEDYDPYEDDYMSGR